MNNETSPLPRRDSLSRQDIQGDIDRSNGEEVALANEMAERAVGRGSRYAKSRGPGERAVQFLQAPPGR